MQEVPAAEYKYKDIAIIRIYGEPDMDRIKAATERFGRRLLEAEARKKQKEIETNEPIDH